MTTNQDCRHRTPPYLAMMAVVAILAPLAMAQGPVAAPVPAVVDPEQIQASIRSDIHRESVRRDELEIKADEAVHAAQQAFTADEYQVAVDKYLEAKSLLEQCGATPHVKGKTQRINEAIAQVYHEWAEDMARKAEADANAGEINEAIKKCAEAIRMNPAMETRMRDMIARFEKQRTVIEYRVDSGEQLIDPGKEDRLYRVDLLYAQGKKLYAEKQWDKARDKFEEILSLNPYNLKAIEYARKINHRLFEAGEVRRETTREERLAESEWKFVTPLLPRAESGLREIEQQPLLRDEAGDAIQRKLNEIILDHIEFEEVTIPTVVQYLKQRSRELDPEKKGVNIFLRLGGGGQADKAGGAAVDDLFGGGGDGGDDDLFGDEAGDDEDGDDGFGGDTGGGLGGAESVPPITIVVDDIPLGEAIRYICRGANLKYRIEKYAVVIASQDVPLDELETRIYPVEQESMSEIGGDGGEEGGTSSMVRYFRQRGVAFPEGSRAVYDPRISRLIATNTPENLAKIEDVIRELNVVDPQVLIECKFVEVQTNKLNNLGFEWTIGRPVGPGTQSTTFNPNDPLMRFNTDLTWTNRDRVFHIIHRDSQLVSWEAIIHALDLRDTTDILSTPRITTQNGEEATIRMATEVFFPESWGEAQFVSNPVGDYFVPSIPEFGEPTELGVRLTVTPNVDADRYTISLDMVPIIQAQIGWLDYSYRITINTSSTINTIRMPIIEARQIETHFNVYDGETVVLGGVIRDITTEVDDRIPGLGDVPLLGRLFRSKVHDAAKANLLIFTTVRLVNPDGSPLREREVRGKPPFRQ